MGSTGNLERWMTKKKSKSGMLLSVQLLANACRVAPFNSLFSKGESLPRNSPKPWCKRFWNSCSVTAEHDEAASPIYKEQSPLDSNLLCGKRWPQHPLGEGNLKLRVTQHCIGLKTPVSVYLNTCSNFFWYLELDCQNGIKFENTKFNVTWNSYFLACLNYDKKTPVLFVLLWQVPNAKKKDYNKN